MSTEFNNGANVAANNKIMLINDTDTNNTNNKNNKQVIDYLFSPREIQDKTLYHKPLNISNRTFSYRKIPFQTKD